MLVDHLLEGWEMRVAQKRTKRMVAQNTEYRIQKLNREKSIRPHGGRTTVLFEVFLVHTKNSKKEVHSVRFRTGRTKMFVGMSSVGFGVD